MEAVFAYFGTAGVFEITRDDIGILKIGEGIMWEGIY